MKSGIARRDAAAAGAIVVLLACVVYAPVPGSSRWGQALHNSAHGPIFGTVAVLALVLLRRHAAGLRLFSNYALAFAISALLGIATELVQLVTGRDASLMDVMNDLLGACAFLLLFYCLDRQATTGRGRRVAAALAALVALAALAAPLTFSAMAYAARAERFPVLADFTRAFDRYFVGSNNAELELIEMPARWRTVADEAALRVRFVHEPYPGVHFDEPVPDWSGYATLVLDLTNPGAEPLHLTLRVHDAQHDNDYEDRFNVRLVLAPHTRQQFRYPLSAIEAAPASRRLDLHQIAGVILFRSAAGPGRELYVSRVYLER